MQEYEKVRILNESYGLTTRECNYFVYVIDGLDWDEHFIADGAHNFTCGDFTLVTQSIDPFACDWPPIVFTSDGSMFELGLALKSVKVGDL